MDILTTKTLYDIINSDSYNNEIVKCKFENGSTMMVKGTTWKDGKLILNFKYNSNPNLRLKIAELKNIIERNHLNNTDTQIYVQIINGSLYEVVGAPGVDSEKNLILNVDGDIDDKKAVSSDMIEFKSFINNNKKLKNFRECLDKEFSKEIKRIYKKHNIKSIK